MYVPCTCKTQEFLRQPLKLDYTVIPLPQNQNHIYQTCHIEGESYDRPFQKALSFHGDNHTPLKKGHA